MMAAQALERLPQAPALHWGLPAGPQHMGSGGGALPCPAVHRWGRKQVAPHFGSCCGRWFRSVAGDNGQVQFPAWSLVVRDG